MQEWIAKPTLAVVPYFHETHCATHSCGLVCIHNHFARGPARAVGTSFNGGTYLYNYSTYGLADANGSDYKYSITIPKVTRGADLAFIARTDGSAENILMSLDGGVWELH